MTTPQDIADPLGTRPAVTPAVVAGEWDSSDVIASVENQAWQHDPDSANVRASQAEEVSPETSQPEDAPPAEQPAEEQPVVEAQGETTPEDATPRAQQRIREMVAERNAEKQRADQLQATLERLIASQTRSVTLQEQVHAEQAARQQAEKAKQDEGNLVARLKALGLREDVAADWLAFEAIQKTEAVQREIAAFRQAETQRQQETAIRDYESSLRKELVSQAKRFKIDDEDIEDLYDQAYATARAKQISNPAEVVAKVLKPYTKIAKPVPPPTKRPDPNDPVHNAISARGRGAERQAGDTPSGRPKKRSIEEIERDMGAGRFD